MKNPQNFQQVNGPGIIKAIDFIKSRIDTGFFDKGILPSLADLSIAANVSSNTMWKAVRELKKQSMLDAVAGGRIRIAGQKNSIIPPKKTRREKLQESVIQDIVNGKLGRKGILPSLNEIQHRYGVCHATARKILESVAEKKLISPYKKTFRYHGGETTASNTVIVFIRESVPYHWVAAERAGKLLSALETDCAEQGMTVSIVDLNLLNRTSCLDSISLIRSFKNCRGILFNLWFMGPENRKELLTELVLHAAVLGKPLAILDHICEFPEATLAPHSHVRLFRPGLYDAGLKMGNHLLSLGHRRVAFISLWHRHSWSILRLAGITDAFAAAGFKQAVVPFTESILEGGYQFIFSLFNCTQKDFERLFGPGLSAPDYAAMFRQFADGEYVKELPTISREDFATYRSEINLVRGLLGKKIRPYTFVLIRDAIFKTIEGRLHVAYERKFIKQIPNLQEHSAIVCANDGTALVSREILIESGIPVPGCMSVAGFDNSQSSQEVSLTSFDFNMPASAHHMLHFVLHHQMWPYAKAGKVVEIEGFVVKRGSTAVNI